MPGQPMVAIPEINPVRAAAAVPGGVHHPVSVPGLAVTSRSGAGIGTGYGLQIAVCRAGVRVRVRLADEA